ncbi:methyltransferase RsmF C-terminal domain-like protein [Stieleria varia]|uniref:Ribosomal RNA small subunit methyltransferase F n=1 Tax=Stieleria varia TaxID=2528005 RepID=A0A5C6BAB7_9BACT|nr:SAM-dependent methyltransferase [Stieleria varia]TWU08216.1 Ribosomal RNA small subunit methyltransferase F [Stieleria varia]
MSIDQSDAIAALGRAAQTIQDVNAFCEALSVAWPSILRRRADVSVADLPVPTEPIPWYPLGHRSLDLSIRPSATLGYGTSDFFLQDAGSLLALAACRADVVSDRPLLVCDLCAAPGGKSTALLESIGDGFLLANEPIRSRVAPLAYNLARTGVPRYAVSSMDPDDLAVRLGGVFDLVLVDAPCSGQALMGRGKQSQASMSEHQIEHSAARQRRILDAALACLRPGGRLVYSTCTFAEAENESQLERLVSLGAIEHDSRDALAAYESWMPGAYRLWPHLHDCAGSFAAMAINLTENAPVLRKEKRQRVERVPIDELTQWYGDTSKMQCINTGAVVWGWPAEVPAWVAQLSVAGPELAHRTGQVWKPSHAAGLRRGHDALTQAFVDVDAETASQFLSGSPITCDGTGWQVVCIQGKPLGWIKASQGKGGKCIGKNQLPTAARLTVKSPG